MKFKKDKSIFVIDSGGIKRWYDKNKHYHRENGPALEYTNGDKFWFKNGRLHRENGPAVEYANGSKYWYLDDIQLSEEEYNKEIARRNLK